MHVPLALFSMHASESFRICSFINTIWTIRFQQNLEIPLGQ